MPVKQRKQNIKKIPAVRKRTAIELFEELAKKYPRKPICRNDDFELSYDEMNSRANCVSFALLGRHAGLKGKVCALLAEKNPNYIAVSLGILKTGAVILPLNPKKPKDQLKYYLADAGADILLTDSVNLELAREVFKKAGKPVISLDEMDFSQKCGNPVVLKDPNDPALLLYTSGSTGTPKGVLHAQKNLVFTAQGMGERFKLGQKDIFWVFNHPASIAFFYIFANFLNGSLLRLADIDRVNAVKSLAREKPTVMHLSISVLRHLLGTFEEKQTLPSVRLVAVGSSSVYKNDYELFCRHFSARAVLANRYMSTEFPLGTDFFIKNGKKLKGDKLPLGEPMPGVELSVKDGEAILASSGFKTRYWRKAIRETEHLYQNRADKTVFETGDIVRSMESGLVYVGRRDSQIKIEGNKVFPEEIEAQLQKHPLVKECAVAVCEDKNEEKHLVAFYSGPAAVEAAELRMFLSAKLLPVQIPSRFIYREKLPLAVYKLDLRKLIKEGANMGCDSASENNLERELGRIWRRVLKIRKTAGAEDFFELGGTSLKVGWLVAELEKSFGVELSRADVYKNAAFSAMAGMIKEKMKEKESNFFRTEAYPEYWNCAWTAINEKIRRSRLNAFPSSFLPAMFFACLPSYVITHKGARRDNDDRSAELLGYPEPLSRIGLSSHWRSFKSQKEAIEFYEKNQARGLILTGSPYYLPPAEVFYKKPVFAQAVREGGMIVAHNTSLFAGSLREGPLVFIGNLNFKGRMDRETFLAFWRGNRAVPGLSGFNNERRFRMLEISGKVYPDLNAQALIKEVLQDTTKEYFAGRVITGKKEDGFKDICFGYRALERYLAERETLPDIVLADLVFRLGRPYLFLADVMEDFAKFQKNLAKELAGTRRILDKWKALGEEIRHRTANLGWEFLIAMTPKVTENNRNFLGEEFKKKLEQEIKKIMILEKKVFKGLSEKLADRR